MNKYESMLVRKKFRKSYNYRCCKKPIRNRTKITNTSRNRCCTYPMIYKRYDITAYNKILCRKIIDDYRNNIEII